MTALRVWIDRLEEGLMALLLTVMTLITFTQVVARYVFNFSFVWALELNTFLFAWLIFLGASYGVRVGSHIGVEMLVRALKPGPARAVSILATLLCMGYAAIVFVGGWVYVEKKYRVGIMAQDIPVPQWVPRLVLPIPHHNNTFACARIRCSASWFCRRAVIALETVVVSMIIRTVRV